MPKVEMFLYLLDVLNLREKRFLVFNLIIFHILKQAHYVTSCQQLILMLLRAQII